MSPLFFFEVVRHVVLHDVFHEKEEKDMKKGTVAGEAGLLVAVGGDAAFLGLVVLQEKVEGKVCVRVNVC